MTEVAALRGTNGYTAVSTFSGAGGSCLGHEMAGFHLAWANEFIPAAQEVFRLNHPDTVLDTRDIRDVKAGDILAAIGKSAGEIDLFDGSPPCSSFSTAGKRDKGWGKVKQYSDTAQRTDDLFYEYARLVGDLQPRVFVAENVSGLVKGTAKGYFQLIMRELISKGYRVKAKALDAKWLGVPQSRERLIFMGVREDIGLEPIYPTPFSYYYSVREAWITLAVPTAAELAEASSEGYAIADEWAKTRPGESSDKFFNLARAHEDRPSPCVTAVGGGTSTASVMHPNEPRKFTIGELKRICAFPDDFQLVGLYSQQWERLGRAVPPLMMRAVSEVVRDQILSKACL